MAAILVEDDFHTLGQEDFSKFIDGTENSLTLKMELLTLTEDFIDEFEATAVLKVPWGRRFDVASAMLGGLNNNEPIPEVQLPVRYDDFVVTNATGETVAVAVGIRIERFGGLTDISETTGEPPVVVKAVPEFAKITVEFRSPTWQVYTHPVEVPEKFILTEELEASGEFLPLPPDGLYWNIDQSTGDFQQPLTEGPSKNLPQGLYTVTIHYADFEAFQEAGRLIPFIGTVNSEIIFSNKFLRRFEPETLLFETPTITEITTPLGKSFDITFALRWKPGGALVIGSGAALTGITTGIGSGVPNGWNVFFRPGFDSPQPIFTEFGSSANPYFRAYTPTSWGTWLPTITT